MENNELILENDFLSSMFDEITDKEVEDLGIKIEEDHFKITNEGQANFFLRRLDEIKAEQDKINHMCNLEIEKFVEKVNSYRQKELHTLESTELYFNNLLEVYATEQLKDSKKKSLKLPFGTLSFKKGQPKYIYDDEAIMKYVKEKDLQQFIRVKEEINKKDLKSNITVGKDGEALINGEVVAGVTITPAEQSFSIKL